MQTLTYAAIVSITVFLAALTMVTFYRLLTGGIVASGLIEDADRPLALSWSKLQLLVISGAGAVAYLYSFLCLGERPMAALPQVPEGLLTLYGLSATVSAAGAGFAAFRASVTPQ